MYPLWGFLEDVYRRIEMSPPSLNVEHLVSGLDALNQELETLNNNQENLFTIRYKFIPLLPGIPTYALGSEVINPLEVIFTSPVRANYLLINGVKVPAGEVDPIEANPLFFEGDGGEFELGPEERVRFIYTSAPPIQFFGIDCFSDVTPENLVFNCYYNVDDEVPLRTLSVNGSINPSHVWWGFLRESSNFKVYELANNSLTQTIPLRRILLNMKGSLRDNLIMPNVVGIGDIPVVSQNRMTYLSIPNKTQVGVRPSIYYFDYKEEPTITIWNLMGEEAFGKGAEFWQYQPGLQISYESYLPLLTIKDAPVWPAKFTSAIKYGVAYTLSLNYRKDLSSILLQDRNIAYEKVGFSDANLSQQTLKPNLASFSSF